MRDELPCGIPDLTELPLDVLLSTDQPEVRAAFHTALCRRGAVGIIFAGHSGGWM